MNPVPIRSANHGGHAVTADADDGEHKNDGGFRQKQACVLTTALAVAEIMVGSPDGRTTLMTTAHPPVQGDQTGAFRRTTRLGLATPLVLSL